MSDKYLTTDPGRRRDEWSPRRAEGSLHRYCPWDSRTAPVLEVRNCLEYQQAMERPSMIGTSTGTSIVDGFGEELLNCMRSVPVPQVLGYSSEDTFTDVYCQQYVYVCCDKVSSLSTRSSPSLEVTPSTISCPLTVSNSIRSLDCQMTRRHIWGDILPRIRILGSTMCPESLTPRN